MKKALISLTFVSLTLASDDANPSTTPSIVSDGLQIYKDATQRGGSIISDIKKIFTDIFSNGQDDDFALKKPIGHDHINATSVQIQEDDNNFGPDMGNSVNIVGDITSGWDFAIKKAVYKLNKEEIDIQELAQDDQLMKDLGKLVWLMQEAAQNNTDSANISNIHPIRQSNFGVSSTGGIVGGWYLAAIKPKEKEETDDDEELFSVKKALKDEKDLVKYALEHKEEIQQAVAMGSKIAETLNDNEFLRSLRDLVNGPEQGVDPKGKKGKKGKKHDDVDIVDFGFLAF